MRCRRTVQRIWSNIQDRYVVINRTGRGRSSHCAQKCGQPVVFRRSDVEFARVWMTIWASLCFLSSLFTVATFSLDASRFRYPERPIVAMALCYMLYCVGYFIRLRAGHAAVACDARVAPSDGGPILIQEGLENTKCAVVFLLLYYFGMAGALWWVMLALTWFLAAGLRWPHEAVARHSSYFHLAAWGVAAVKTIVILVLRDVDGDELTGLCHVGNQSRGSLLGFVLAPLVAYLAIGAALLAAGVVAAARGRRRGEKLDARLVRVAVFAMLYPIPAACVVACHLYEYVNRDAWTAPLGGAAGGVAAAVPNVEMFMLKTFMCLVVGLTSGVWVWSRRTIDAWRQLADRLTLHRFGKKRAPGVGRDFERAGAAAHQQRPPVHYRTVIAVVDAKRNKSSGSETVV
ncbi:PREDICTED: frizzled-9-like [Priapulus caudatus]|uniref:Frizzled-9-like n=1 Tax=Priapulus caudatus TaxID=37621 RepID=A0ABM1F447_PRICU|nr:PREDICTED: frizzled-9-like [Priapulus caudatus]